MSPFHALHQLAGIAQQIPPLRQLLFFPAPQLGPLQFADLKFQAVNAPGLLRLVHPEG